MNEKHQDMLEMFKSGKTYKFIGRKYGVSRQRVQQILSKYWISRIDGGAHKVATERRMALQEYRDIMQERFLSSYLCPKNVADIYPKMYKKRYLSSRSAALRSGSGWNLSIVDWWDAWNKSGKFNKSGRFSGSYCMTRINKNLPWQKNNIKICTKSKAIKELRASEK